MTNETETIPQLTKLESTHGQECTTSFALPLFPWRWPADSVHPPAEQALGTSATTLKRLCRHYGMERWPYRQISGVDRAITRLEAEIEAAPTNSPPADAEGGIRDLRATRQDIINV